jgi:hypothetical protein
MERMQGHGKSLCARGTDPIASKHGQVRVVDKFGSDYLYPKSSFRPVTLPAVLNDKGRAKPDLKQWRRS